MLVRAQTQDLLLAMLVDNEPLRLAFNSAHVAPLLTGTRQNSLPNRAPNPIAQAASIVPGGNRAPLAMAPSSMSLAGMSSADLPVQPATANGGILPQQVGTPPFVIGVSRPAHCYCWRC